MAANIIEFIELINHFIIIQLFNSFMFTSINFLIFIYLWVLIIKLINLLRLIIKIMLITVINNLKLITD